MAYAQRPGRTSRLLDDRFDLDSGRKGTSGQGGTGVGIKKQDSGPVVLNLSKELTREIFEEFPVVQDAYARHVPGVSGGFPITFSETDYRRYRKQLSGRGTSPVSFGRDIERLCDKMQRKRLRRRRTIYSINTWRSQIGVSSITPSLYISSFIADVTRSSSTEWCCKRSEQVLGLGCYRGGSRRCR